MFGTTFSFTVQENASTFSITTDVFNCKWFEPKSCHKDENYDHPSG